MRQEIGKIRSMAQNVLTKYLDSAFEGNKNC
jgi:hypothetical protein